MITNLYNKLHNVARCAIDRLLVCSIAGKKANLTDKENKAIEVINKIVKETK